MAVVSVASLKVEDHRGKSKTIPFYFPTSASVAAITTAMQDIASAYDDMADAVPVAITLNLAIPLPAGLKSSAAAGNTVNEGANTSWDVQDSNYGHGIFFPAIAETSWSGDSLTAGAELGALINAVELSQSPDGSNLTGFRYSDRRVRK